jgi:methyl-accepting chemotaxis protein
MFSLRHTRRLLADLTVATRLGLGFGALIVLMLALTVTAVLVLGDGTVARGEGIWLIGSMGVLAVLGGGAIAWTLIDSIKWPLDRAIDLAARPTDDALEAELLAEAPQDEFGNLHRALLSLRRRLQTASQEAVLKAQAAAEAVARDETPVPAAAAVRAVREDEPGRWTPFTDADFTPPPHLAGGSAQDFLSIAVTAANRGGEVVSQVVANMDEIRNASRQIFEIIGTIDNIAFQTNLLALHAAVEAAQAGDKGKGFAVVAGEVRALAVRAANAAKEIKELVHASAEKVEFGGQLARDADLTMDAIIVSVQRMTEIVDLTRQSQPGTGQALLNGQGVLQLDQLTQRSASMVTESASTAEALRLQAERLQKVVSAFQLLQRTQEAAWNAHHAISSARQRARGESPQPTPPFPSTDWGAVDEATRLSSARDRRRTDRPGSDDTGSR